jgi:hypothetical protein
MYSFEDVSSIKKFLRYFTLLGGPDSLKSGVNLIEHSSFQTEHISVAD